eukprot:Filipodium_phascolosomae@DN712_c0_g1_i1.p1
MSRNTGASRFCWYYRKHYKPIEGFPLHYRPVSSISKFPINWRWGKPASGYEGLINGPYTLQLQGLPMGHTCEVLQEQLKKFYSKFGTINNCRVMPHARDPYQCNGTGYITFDKEQPAMKAADAWLQLSEAGGIRGKIIRVRSLITGKMGDNVNKIVKQHEHSTGSLQRRLSEVYHLLRNGGEMSISDISSVTNCPARFWRNLIETNSTMFLLRDNKVWCRPTPSDELFVAIKTVEPVEKLRGFTTRNWLSHRRRQLPSQTFAAARKWDYKDALPEDIQRVGRPYPVFHDRRYNEVELFQQRLEDAAEKEVKALNSTQKADTAKNRSKS